MKESRTLSDQQLHSFYYSSNILRVFKSRRMICVAHVANMEKMTNVYKILVEKLQGKKSTGGFMNRWENNIKMDLTETCGE
jgi:hypothetical protein